MKQIFVLVFIALFLGTFSSADYAVADRFVNNKDGTVTDMQTGLVWADKDNGRNSDWFSANDYCEGYIGGGKAGWRMPTVDELMQLYSAGAYGSSIKKTGNCIWSSDVNGSSTAYFCFDNGRRYWGYQSSDTVGRALPVQSGHLIIWLFGNLIIYFIGFLIFWFFIRNRAES